MTAPECVICGHPTLRAGQHADWCESTKATLRAIYAPPAGCTVDGCPAPHHALGLCGRHYGQVYRARAA